MKSIPLFSKNIRIQDVNYLMKCFSHSLIMWGDIKHKWALCANWWTVTHQSREHNYYATVLTIREVLQVFHVSCRTVHFTPSRGFFHVYNQRVTRATLWPGFLSTCWTRLTGFISVCLRTHHATGSTSTWPAFSTSGLWTRWTGDWTINKLSHKHPTGCFFYI